MISLDLGEQLHARAFELVGPDAAEDTATRRGQVLVQEIVAEVAHDQLRPIAMMPQEVTVPHHADRRYLPVAAPAKRHEIASRRREISRFTKPRPVTFEYLVGSDDEGVDVPSRHPGCLEFGQRVGGADRIYAFATQGPLDLVLIDDSGIDGKSDARLAQDRGPNKARRSEHNIGDGRRLRA